MQTMELLYNLADLVLTYRVLLQAIEKPETLLDLLEIVLDLHYWQHEVWTFLARQLPLSLGHQKGKSDDHALLYLDSPSLQIQLQTFLALLLLLLQLISPSLSTLLLLCS